PNADPDHDGLANSIEFVLGSDPSQSTPGNALASNVVAQNIVFQLVRVKAAGEAGFVSVIELTDDPSLATWQAPAPDTLQITDNGTTETVTVTVARNLAARLFARIRVIAP
ncbi:MAG: hypothetical protein MUF13_06695, partial [Akkermansiaceae bacterium]|nr:hypothetical protein [Akkermansiaceae bacterium]